MTTITRKQIEQAIKDTQQVHFELTALLNWIKYEKPDNAAVMMEALGNVYQALEGDSRLLKNMREVFAVDDSPIKIPNDPSKRPNYIPVLRITCR